MHTIDNVNTPFGPTKKVRHHSNEYKPEFGMPNVCTLLWDLTRNLPLVSIHLDLVDSPFDCEGLDVGRDSRTTMLDRWPELPRTPCLCV